MSDPQNLPLILRYSTTAGSVPPVSEFTLNSFVVNWADGLLYSLDPDGQTLNPLPIMPGAINPVSSIASGATTDIGSRRAQVLSITGTTAITSFGTKPNRLKRVRFTGSLTLTHDAVKLALPGGASITTQAGDAASFVSDGSGNWVCLSYMRGDGTPLFGNYLKPSNNLSDVQSAALARANIGAAAAEDLYTTIVQTAMNAGGLAGEPNGFFDPFSSSGGIDLTKSSGIYLDQSAGALVGGVGAPGLVLEREASIPWMTGPSSTIDGQSGHTVSADSVSTTAGCDPFYAFNGGTAVTSANGAGLGWNAGSGGYPHWIMRGLPAAITVAGYIMAGRSDGYYYPQSWQLQGSNDQTFGTYTVLDQQTGVTVLSGGAGYVFPVAASKQGSFRFHRIYVTAGSDGTYLAIQQIHLLQMTPLVEISTSLPAMLSNTTVAGGGSGYAALYSTQGSGPAWAPYKAGYAQSGTNGCWNNNNAALPSWNGRQVPNPIKIGAYWLSGYWDGQYAYSPTSWEFHGSNDPTFATYTVLDVRNNNAIGGGGRQLCFISQAKQANFTCHRVYIKSASNNAGDAASAVDISQIEMLQVIVGTEAVTSIPYMTSNTTTANNAAGYTASESTAGQAAYPPWKALDGLLSVDTNYANGVWLPNVNNGVSALILAMPSATKVMAYRLTSFGPSYSPLSWTVDGSNDNGQTWTTVDSRTVPATIWAQRPGTGEITTTWRYFSVKTPGSYSRYRLNVTATADNYVRVNGFEMLQGTSGNMAYISKPYTNPRGVPTKLRMIVAMKQNTGTININTNVIGSVSRDGGVNMRAVTLTPIGPFNGYTLYMSAFIDVSDLPQGQTLVGGLASNDNTVGISADFVGVVGLAA